MIRGCIFNLNGTLVDKYSLSTKLSLRDAFYFKNIIVPKNLLQKNIERDKLDHIEKILKDKIIMNLWKIKYERMPNENDKLEIYDYFNKLMLKNKDIEIIPQTYRCLRYLKKNNIKIGITTDLSEPLMDSIIRKFDLDKYIDSKVSSTSLDLPGRQEPYMIKYNMRNMGIDNTTNIIKIDDRCIGIKEGINANYYTVGVSRWSSHMNIESIEESYLMDKINKIDNINNFKDYYNYSIFNEKIKESIKVLKNSKADFVIRTLEDLPRTINVINNKKLYDEYHRIKMYESR